MTEGLRKKLEIVTNLAIILITFLLGYILISEKLLKTSLTDKDQHSETNSSKLKSNDKILLSDFDLAKNGKTLLIVLSDGCKFCLESSQFYQKIVSESKKQENLKLIAVFPQDVEVGSNYLKTNGIKIDNIVQKSLVDLGVKGTPTLILADSTGTLRNYWVGRLPPNKELEILEQIK